MGKYIVILTTYPSIKEARRITEKLLGKRLIACANIAAGIESIFWWKGRIDKAGEVLVIMKTVKRHFRAVSREIKMSHSYEVPEIVSLPICGGSRDYLRWIEVSVRG